MESLLEREVAVGKREEDVAAREVAVAAREREIIAFKMTQIKRKETLGVSDNMRKVGNTKKKQFMDDVPALVDKFHASGGEVPIEAVVAEVQCLKQNIASRYADIKNIEEQAKELDKILKMEEKADTVIPKPKHWKIRQRNRVAELTELKDSKEKEAESQEKRFGNLRKATIKRFVPLLLQMVTKHEGIFESDVHDQSQGEYLLEQISVLCSSVKTTKDCPVRQRMPSAHDKSDTRTLMMLYDIALQATPKLKALARKAVAQHKDSEVSVSPVKGIRRLLEKVQKYKGDYTRILDFSRITIVCNDLKTLRKCLSWFLEKQDGGFRCCRIKDRLSRKYDNFIQDSGGNRDILMNGWLNLGRNREFVVEVQLHLRSLYQLRNKQHVLYEGLRVLSVSNDIKHSGKLTEKVINKISDGIVRKLYVYSSFVTVKIKEQLIEVLQCEPCPILKLVIEDVKCSDKLVIEDGKCNDECEDDSVRIFDGMTLDRVMVSSTKMVACRRIQSIWFGGTGLIGEFAALEDLFLNKFTHLHTIGLSRNEITGKLPAWIGKLEKLRVLKLHENPMNGPIPKELGECTQLRKLVLGGDRGQLNGSIPKELGNCTQLIRLMLFGSQLRGTIPKELKNLSNLEWLSVRKNQLSGPIPDWLGNLSNLILLDVSMNKFSGDVPAEALSKLSKLHTLGLILPTYDEERGQEKAGPKRESNPELRITKVGRDQLRGVLNNAQRLLGDPNPKYEDDEYWPDLKE